VDTELVAGPLLLVRDKGVAIEELPLQESGRIRWLLKMILAGNTSELTR
jgi:hypothetical protein